MKKQPAVEPIVHFSVAELMRIYLEEELITRPELFGLPDFSGAALRQHGFEREGHDDFHLYEQCYRIAGSRVCVNFKVYHAHGEPESNGVDIGPGARLRTALRQLPCVLGPDTVRSVQIWVFDDLTAGSLIFNDAVVMRFSLNTRGHYRNGYTLDGISTNGTFAGAQATGCETSFAKSQNDETVFPGASGKHARHAAMRELTDCLVDTFGAAFQGGAR